MDSGTQKLSLLIVFENKNSDLFTFLQVTVFIEYPPPSPICLVLVVIRFFYPSHLFRISSCSYVLFPLSPVVNVTKFPSDSCMRFHKDTSLRVVPSIGRFVVVVHTLNQSLWSPSRYSTGRIDRGTTDKYQGNEFRVNSKTEATLLNRPRGVSISLTKGDDKKVTWVLYRQNIINGVTKK